MANKKTKKSQINLTIELDEKNVPVHMEWMADDSPDTPSPQECKAMLLSIFDKKTRDTLKIDLWTQDLQVVEMDKFMYQTLRSLVDTYYKATDNKELANEMYNFAQYFGEKTEVITKKES